MKNDRMPVTVKTAPVIIPSSCVCSLSFGTNMFFTGASSALKCLSSLFYFQLVFLRIHSKDFMK